MNLDFSKHILLEASAGTGKTYSITEIVLDRIENNIPINKLAVLTFTEKAAGELKDRIREKLVSQNSTKSKESISILPSAMIGTIHQFCRSLIKKYAYNLNFSSEFIEIEDDKKHKEEFFKIFWNKIEKEDSRDLIELIKLLGFSHYKKLISEIISKTDNKEILLPEKFDEENFNTLFQDIKEKFIHLDLKKDTGKTYTRLVEFTEEIENLKSIEKFLDLAIELKIINKDKDSFKLSVNTNNLIQKKDNPPISELIDNLVKENELRKFYPLLTRLIQDLNLFNTTYNDYKKSRDEISKDELILFSVELTKIEKIKKELQESYSFVIIDECQDSNKAQIELMQNIFKNKKNGLIYVGDIKQSIYSFRGADIESYQTAIYELNQIGLHKKILDTSYRSSKPLIDFFNKIFSNFESFQSFYSPVKTCEERINNQFTDNSVFILDPEFKETDLRDDRREKEFEEISKCIKKIVNNKEYKIFDKEKKTFREINFSDIAILSLTNPSLDFLLTNLAKKNIPANKYKSSDFYSNHIIISLIQILNYIENPNNSKSLFLALNSDLFLISEKELFDLQNQNNSQTHSRNSTENNSQLIQKKLLDYHKLRYLKPASVILYDLLIDLKIIELVSLGFYGKRNLTNIYHLIDLVAETQVNENLTFGGVVGKFNSRIESSIDEEIVKLESDRKSENYQSIQCMTIHASKGLEFPVCIIFDLYKNDQKPKQNFQIVFDEKQNVNLEINLSKMKTKNFEKSINQIKKEENEELQRLVYVALTRAKDYLVISKNLINKNKFGFLFEILQDFPFEKQNDLKNKNQITEQIENEEIKIEKKFLEINIDKKTFTKIKGYKIISFSSLHEKQNKEILDKAKFKENSLIQNDHEKKDFSEHKNENEASNFGLYCHKILEVFPWEKLNETDEKIKKEISSLVEEFQFEFIIGNSENYNRKLIEEYIFATLKKEYPINEEKTEFFQFKDIDYLDRERKFYFQMNSKNADLLVGVGDGMFFLKGKYYILDWKTNMIQDKNIDVMVKETYYEQCLIYSLNLLSNLDAENVEISYKEKFGGMLFIFLRNLHNKEGSVFIKPSLEEIINFEKSL